MRPGRGGGAALEFALTLPVLLVLLAGVIEWGWYLHQEVSVTWAARDGALAGSLTPPASDVEGEAVAQTRRALEAAGFDGDAAEVNAALEDSDSGALVRVTAAVPYASLLHLLPVPASLRGDSAFLLVRP